MTDNSNDWLRLVTLAHGMKLLILHLSTRSRSLWSSLRVHLVGANDFLWRLVNLQTMKIIRENFNLISVRFKLALTILDTFENCLGSKTEGDNQQN